MSWQVQSRRAQFTNGPNPQKVPARPAKIPTGCPPGPVSGVHRPCARRSGGAISTPASDPERTFGIGVNWR